MAVISSTHCQPYISAVPPPHAQDDPLNGDGERETTSVALFVGHYLQLGGHSLASRKHR
ncbi:unnamed protein product, partial [Pleuronectes platessa]